MSSKTTSPTATLLRNSRLFSMPPPLARPLNDLMGHVQSNRASDTATLPYPTQQAIATTPAALARGDWGLKRALPLKSTTRTSTPIYRINAVDTREHITDFESASDLALTLQKFQELNLPITSQVAKAKLSAQQPRTSVFDSSMDNTDPNVPKTTHKRWKYHGPWTAGMNQGQFESYIKKQVAGRRAEFEAMLRKDLLRKLQNDARQTARQAGTDLEEAVAEVKMSDEDFVQYMKQLRQNGFGLEQHLAGKIADFLDLPPLPPKGETSITDQGPPQTHPSAGLSYLVSDAYLANHPKYGPQARRAPVEGRIIVGITSSNRPGAGEGKVGVAGVVTTGTSYSSGTTRNPRIRSTPGSEEQRKAEDRDAVTSIGVDTDGGNRIWTEAYAATVDTQGRIGIKVANPEKLTVDVHTGRIDEAMEAPQVRRVLPMSSSPMPQLDAMINRRVGTMPSGTVAPRNAADALTELLRAREPTSAPRHTPERAGAYPRPSSS